MDRLSPLDQSLLRLLTANARASVSELAKQLGVSRLTVQNHMQQLERHKVIEGYTVKLRSDYAPWQIAAYMLIATDQKRLGPLVRALEKIAEIHSLYSISGEYDLVAELRAENTTALDVAMDKVTAIEGVLRSHSSVLLSKKFER
ncbi:Lrp/AsnC family transcriptional regulator [Aestuariicella hydrocarbonica]|uniref:Lrp/AsnC family transcriptional regulator n=1 Tax=Pseudomaricurvus hydrocarbonicus TaxID=1470433 RepID=A0A9E5JR94_9GAMM|nr:Lrp/AsnC family transcriptional regulator [Aestuariicella hydrocarbonica]NHO65054.1 Lrp/AsnC family transcriptional regulator [Aestuariicella hydrocarbonica]